MTLNDYTKGILIRVALYFFIVIAVAGVIGQIQMYEAERWEVRCFDEVNGSEHLDVRQWFWVPQAAREYAQHVVVYTSGAVCRIEVRYTA